MELICVDKTTSIIKKNNINCCLNCIQLLRTKNKFQSHETVWENKDFCANLESLIKKANK